MKNLPKAIKTLVVLAVDAQARTIDLEADPDVIDIIRQNGMGSIRADPERGVQVLTVSERFSFQEVRDWLLEQAA